ncbi:hypothetical protein ACA910_019569 [Epithemia clementina (nom. ined.)]
MAERSQLGQSRLRTFHAIKELENELSKNAKELSKLSADLLKMKPPGKLDGDIVTAVHILRNMIIQSGNEVEFFDSRKGIKLLNSSSAIHDLFLEDKPMILRLNGLKGLAGAPESVSDGNELNFLAKMQAAIDSKKVHPVIEDVKSGLAKALLVPVNEYKSLTSSKAASVFSTL